MKNVKKGWLCTNNQPFSHKNLNNLGKMCKNRLLLSFFVRKLRVRVGNYLILVLTLCKKVYFLFVFNPLMLIFA